jgi:predicted permease
VNGIIEVLTENILPIFVVAGFGALLRRKTRIDKQALSQLTLYVLAPSLFYASLVNADLAGDEVGQIVLFAMVTSGVMAALAFAAGLALRLKSGDRAALMLLAMFTNSGNYGLTLNQLRYGEAGLSRAVIYFTVSTILVYTVGVFVASSGKAGVKDGLKRVATLPTFYAIILAMIVYNTDFRLPVTLQRGIEIAGAGSIPVMLIVLGMQMADLESLRQIRLSAVGVGLRLAAGPIIAVGVATLIGLDGLGYNVSIIQASLPTAVITTILATEFDVAPTAVTTGVVLSTLLSPITLTAAINLLGL